MSDESESLDAERDAFIGLGLAAFRDGLRSEAAIYFADALEVVEEQMEAAPARAEPREVAVTLRCHLGYIARDVPDFGLMPGFCIMAFKPLENDDE